MSEEGGKFNQAANYSQPIVWLMFRASKKSQDLSFYAGTRLTVQSTLARHMHEYTLFGIKIAHC